MRETVQVKCYKCGYIIEVTSKKRPLKVKCPQCKSIGLLRVPPPPEVEAIPIKPTPVPAPPTKEPRVKIRSKKARAIGIAIILICAILVPSVVYYFIIPRVELKISTTFFESLGPIVISTKIKNVGTSEVTDFSMEIKVYDNNISALVCRSYCNRTKFAPWYVGDEKIHTANFSGDHYHEYTISLNITFAREDRKYTYSFTHAAKDYAMVNFKDTILRWE